MTRAATKTIAFPPRSERKGNQRSRKRILAAKSQLSRMALRARRKFLRIFPNGFRDHDYIDLERVYKWNAHLAWQGVLDKKSLRKLLANGKFQQISALAVRIESRTNLLFSFDKMALRDAVKSPAAAEAFAIALYDLLYGFKPLEIRFSGWLEALAQLPPTADQGSHVATGHRVCIHRTTRRSFFPKTDGHPGGSTAIRLRTPIFVPANLVRIQRPPQVCKPSP
jgi:hypothetical protein